MKINLEKRDIEGVFLWIFFRFVFIVVEFLYFCFMYKYNVMFNSWCILNGDFENIFGIGFFLIVIYE